MTTSFDFDWKFELSDSPAFAEALFDDSSWRELNVPHDWSIELIPTPESPGKKDNGFFPGGVGWYRKRFTVPDDAKGRKVYIQFDGVYMESKVYLNGHLLGERPYGYVSFQYDLTPWLEYDGDNVLAVRVDHSKVPTSRWYSGSGIYRHVWLNIVHLLHVAHWGTAVTTPVITENEATINIRTEVQNNFPGAKNCKLLTTIIDTSGESVAQMESEQSIAASKSGMFEQTLQVSCPRLWSIENPSLYTVKTVVQYDGRAVDTYRTPFGIRELKFDAQTGFWINGKKVKLKGMCLHGDAGCLGVAVPERAWERRLEILREMGCNAIRLSHNPPAPELLDLCDRLGFVVIDEAFDKWRSGYYKDYFDKWWRTDLDAMILRDRNHPSVILWGIGNEVVEQGTQEGTECLRALVNHAHAVDPSRLVTCAMFPRGIHADTDSVNAAGFADAMDVASYNYQEQWFDADKAAHPNRIILSAESYPYYLGSREYGTKNELFNPFCNFEAKNPWNETEKRDYVAGQFIWAGIDYLGESYGWPSKGWCNGIIDTCGFPKPRAAFHRSVWNAKPMVQIAVQSDAVDIDTGHAAWSWPNLSRSWNFPFPDQIIRVETVTNCQQVELFLNKKSLGVRKTSDFTNNTITWNVPYQTGFLHAVATNEEIDVAHDYLHTAGIPASIQLLPDRASFMSDGQDIVNVEVRLLDGAGILVPNVDCKIDFTIEGPGNLIEVDNGDLRSTESYKGNRRTTYFGRALAIIQSHRNPGTIRLLAHGDNLPVTAITLKSVDDLPAILTSEHR